jgi:hypothetical protein
VRLLVPLLEFNLAGARSFPGMSPSRGAPAPRTFPKSSALGVFEIHFDEIFEYLEYRCLAHQEQQATVAHLIPAALGRLNQPFNLAAGEVFSVAAPRQCVLRFASLCSTGVDL